MRPWSVVMLSDNAILELCGNYMPLRVPVVEQFAIYWRAAVLFTGGRSNANKLTRVC
jgi:hypothetical protein